MKPAREMTNEELTAAFWADLRRPFREVRPTHLRRLREEAEGITEVAVAKEKRRRKKLKRWTEKSLASSPPFVPNSRPAILVGSACQHVRSSRALPPYPTSPAHGAGRPPRRRG